MPRIGLDAEAVVAAAAQLADAEGLEALTLARLAAQLGIRSPSLYAHVGGLEDLRLRLGARGARQLSAAIQEAAAGRARRDALEACAAAYRSYAREHPGSYQALQFSGQTPEGAQLVDAVLAVLRGYKLEGDDAMHATRIVRAALHGFAQLEGAGGYQLPLSLDETFGRMIVLLDEGLGASTS
jgi:AcrR family transcriptional regulator